MTLSAAEQYLLELINRARLDPSAEALRNGIQLNAGLEPGQISAAAKQVLAPNAQLEQAAVLHSQFMLAADIFSHTGAGGSNPGLRIDGQGYDWTTYGENIAYVGSTGVMTVEGSIAQLYKNLFLSAGHRVNTMNDAFAEVGLGAEVGRFTSGATTYNAAMLTENFATRTTGHFLTGVAYADSNGDQFYGMTEGTGGVVFQAAGKSASTTSAGGYGVEAGNGRAVTVTGNQGAMQFSLVVDMRPGNVKLDLVGGDTFHASGSAVLGTGVNDLVLLGVAQLNGTGNAAGNDLTGNKAANVLTGLGGADLIRGGQGADMIKGGRGNDVLHGDDGADDFVFQLRGGRDQVMDFDSASGDTLRLDDALWAGQTLTTSQVVAEFASLGNREVMLQFASGVEVQLSGLTTLAGLAASIEIF